MVANTGDEQWAWWVHKTAAAAVALTDFGTDIKGSKTGTLFDCDFNDTTQYALIVKRRMLTMMTITITNVIRLAVDVDDVTAAV